MLLFPARDVLKNNDDQLYAYKKIMFCIIWLSLK